MKLFCVDWKPRSNRNQELSRNPISLSNRFHLSIRKALHVIFNYTVKVNSPGSDKSFVDYVNAHEKKRKLSENKFFN